MKITVYSHYFEVSDYQKDGYVIVKEFAFRYAEYDYRKIIQARQYRMPVPKPELKRIHCAMTENKRLFHFHINTLDDFLLLLKEKGFSQYSLEEVPLYQPTPVEIRTLPKYIPRDDQLPFIEYVRAGGRSKVLNLQTGFGKTFIALYSASALPGRILISVETRFFNIWSEALLPGPKQILDLKEDEVIFISGSNDLRKLISHAIAGKLDHIKVIVVASRTIAIYFETWEKMNGSVEGFYDLEPKDFYHALNVGTRIKDEVHLKLASNLFEELFTHCPLSLSLSATLEDGSFNDKLVKIMFPMEMRPQDADFNKYIDVTCLMYRLEHPDKVRTSHRGSTDYNHNAYEQHIMRYPKMVRNYYRIVKDWLEGVYLAERKPGMRAVVFFETIELASWVFDQLSKDYPEVTFGRYVASIGDDYQKARSQEVLVTTVKSFGTGFDVDNLYCALMTNAIRSQKTNLQVLGRLRQLKNYPGVYPKFFYLTCLDIPKHLEYHNTKRLQFSGKVNSLVENSIHSAV